MKAKHPMQPIVWAKDGVIRFKANKIVEFLARERLNELAMMDFPREDWEQLGQLIGYSVSGYGDLSYVRKSIVREADAIAEKMSRKRSKSHKAKER